METVIPWVGKPDFLISSPRTEDYTLLANACNSALMSCCYHLTVYYLTLFVDYKMCSELIWHIFNLQQEYAQGNAIKQTFCMFIKLKEENNSEHIASAAVLWVCCNNFMQLHLTQN